MAFIDKTDYDASIHAEILDGITRSDDAAIDLAEDMAIEEMKGYLNGRFDVDAIFAATGSSRNKLVLMFAIDIVLYHLHSAHNPQRFPQVRKDRYDRAVEWLKQVQKGDIVPNALPKLVATDGTTGGANSIAFTSQPKRINSF